MNLHAIVRGIIPAVNPDESVVWYRSTGQQASGYGEIEPTYADPVTVAAQVQSEGDEALFHADRAGDNSIVRKFYLMASPATRPAGIVRVDARNGDYLQREDGTWWLVVAVLEDFSFKSGWTCVRGVQQNTSPAALQPKETEDGGD